MFLSWAKSWNKFENCQVHGKVDGNFASAGIDLFVVNDFARWSTARCNSSNLVFTVAVQTFDIRCIVISVLEPTRGR